MGSWRTEGNHWLGTLAKVLPSSGEQRMSDLNPERAFIFRITHIANVPWILDHGLYSRGSGRLDASFRSIGNPDLIERRRQRSVPIAPGGALSDYIPFYLTPYSIMLYNIKTGYGGTPHVPNEEIVIVVSSLHRVTELGVSFVFTDQHAYTATTQYFNDLGDLGSIDWALIQSRDFKHDPEDPGKKERYQAEALIHHHLPIEGLLGMACHSQNAQERLQDDIAQRRMELQVVMRPAWYF